MILLAIAALRTLTICFPDRWLDSALAAAILLTAGLLGRRDSVASFGTASPRLLAWSALGGLASIGAVQFVTGATVYRFDTFGAMLLWASLLAACWAAPSEKMLHTALAFAAAVAVAVLIHPIAELTGPFQSRNNAASFLLLFLPIALHRGFAQESRRALPLSLAALIAAAIFATGSRAGAALAVLEVIGLLMILRPSRRGFLAAAGVLVAALLAGGALLDRVREANPLGFRPEIVASTVGMIRDRPLTGFGLGTFESVYPAYATFDTGLIVNYVHNDWAQVAAEGGLLGVVCFGFLLVAVVRVLRAKPWSIGLLAVLLHALVDYPFARVGVALWFAILLGIAVNRGRES